MFLIEYIIEWLVQVEFTEKLASSVVSKFPAKEVQDIVNSVRKPLQLSTPDPRKATKDVFLRTCSPNMPEKPEQIGTVIQQAGEAYFTTVTALARPLNNAGNSLFSP